VERHSDIRRFVKGLNAFRQRRALLDDAAALTLNQLLARAKLQWHGVALGEPDWSDSSHSLAFTIEGWHRRIQLHAILNAYWEPLTFALPAAVDQPAPSESSSAHARVEGWRHCIDTAHASPDDIRSLEDAPLVTSSSLVAQPRSIVVLARIVHDALGARR
jgi:glycogen operon protein